MRIIFKDGQILDLNGIEKIIIEPTDSKTLSNIEFLKISLGEFDIVRLSNDKIQHKKGEQINE